MDEDTKKRIKALVGPSNKPVYADALHAITHGSYTADGRTVNIGDVDKGTKSVISNLKLDTTDTVAYHLKAEELKKINEEIEAKKTQLIPFDQEIAEHEANKNKVSKVRQFFKDWLTPSYLTTKLVTRGALIIGGVAGLYFGAGLLGISTVLTPGLATGSISAAFSGFSSAAALLLSTTAGATTTLAAAAGMSLPALIAATGIGVGTYSFLLGSGGDWIKGGLHDLQKKHIYERKKEKKRKEIGLHKLEEDKKEAEKIIAKYQEDHKAKVAVLNTERKKYAGEQSRLNGLIEQATSRGDDTKSAELQTELEKVTAYLLNLDGLISVLKTTEKGSMAGVTHMDDISRNIQAMGLDDTTSKQLMDIATEKEKEWLGTQKELMDTKFRDGILKEKDKIEPELLKAVTDFLQGTADDKMRTDMFNKLRIDAPDLHRLVRTLQNLPKQSVLQKDVREILGPIFVKAQLEIDLKPAKDAVRKAFGSLDEKMKELLEGSPGLISKDVDTSIPKPTGKDGFKFSDWLESITDKVLLEKLKMALLKIGAGYKFEGEKLVDEISTLRKTIEDFFKKNLSEGLRKHFEDDSQSKLSEAANILQKPSDFSLPTPGGPLLENVNALENLTVLKNIRDLFPLIKNRIFFNPDSNKLELISEAEADLTKKIERIEPKDVRHEISTNPKLITILSRELGHRPELKDPDVSITSLDSYGKKLIGTMEFSTLLKTLNEVVKDYVITDGKLEKIQDQLKRDIRNTMNDFLEANGLDDDLPLDVISAGFATAKINKNRKIPRLPSAPNFEKSVSFVNDPSILNEILDSCVELKTSCFYNFDETSIELGKSKSAKSKVPESSKTDEGKKTHDEGTKLEESKADESLLKVRESVEKFTEEEAEIISKHFNYGNAERERNDKKDLLTGTAKENVKKYGRILINLLRDNKDKFNSLGNYLLQEHKDFVTGILKTENIGWDAHPTWAYWDICKQYYLWEQIGKKDEKKGEYLIANPFENEKKRQDMQNLTLGCYLYAVYKRKDGKDESEENKEGYRARWEQITSSLLAKNPGFMDQVIALINSFRAKTAPRGETFSPEEELHSYDYIKLGKLVRDGMRAAEPAAAKPESGDSATQAAQELLNKSADLDKIGASPDPDKE